MVRMGHEQVVAFHESWLARWAAAASAQWAWSSAIAQSGAAALQGKTAPQALRAAQAATHRVLAAGLKPVHGKAVANAKRLGRRK
jgi:hypothetical protein